MGQDRGLPPIRAFAKHFTNMTPGQQKEFERALLEIDNSLEITSLANSLDLLQRSPDQSLPIPELQVESGVRGGTLRWNILPDQKIDFYEIDLSETSNFAAFTTTPTFGNVAVINGITGTRYVRVRGVRKDGTTTPYSTTQTISPNLFDINIYSQENFYVVGIPSSKFYPIARIKYTPTDNNGKSMVFGFAAIYADPEVMIYGLDDIQLRLTAQVFYSTGQQVSSDVYWQCSAGEYFGCYSVGPLSIENPPRVGDKIQFRLEIKDSVQNASQNTTVNWAHINAVETGVSD